VERKLFGIAVKWLLLAIVVIAIGGYILARVIGGNHQEVRQAQTNEHSAEAMQAAGQAAVQTVIKRNGEEARLGDVVNQASEEIDNAPDPVAARRAALGAACQLRLYRDDPACHVQPAHTP